MKKIVILLCVLYSFILGSVGQETICENIILLDSIKVLRINYSKYKEAYNYILNDSINQGGDIFVSDVIVDMDRFSFRSQAKSDSILSPIIDSLTRYSWFENFSSPEIKELFGEQNRKAESILFFSLIEKNTLRADLFFKREDEAEFRYNWLSNYNVQEVYSYFFLFSEDGRIEHVYRTKMIYEI